MGESARPPGITPTLVGRTGQLATLRALVEQTKGGEGHFALISGEAGVGKSRLIAEMKAYAEAQGLLQLQGNCYPRDLAYPYAPLLDLLRSLYIAHPPEPLATDLENLAQNIFPLLPELVSERTIPASTLEPEQEKRRLFAVLAKFFIDLAARSPILLVIEDVHWSDSISLDFLHYLARRITSQPVLLLVTYRRDEIQSMLRNWLAQLDHERLAQEIQLTSLALGEVDTMLSSIFDERHTAFDMRRFLHGELLDALYALTEGNPFFVEEILSSLIAEGDIYFEQGYWNRKTRHAARIPRSVQAAVQGRTEHLGEAARQVLNLAAIAGRRFDFVLLQQLTRFDEEQLLQIMKELVSAQLVVEESADQFAFRHALTRQAIYAQLLTRERVLLHGAIATTMEQLHPAARDARLEDLAYHFYQARAWEKTLDYAQRAGEKALRLYSLRAAIDYFTWVLEAVDHLALPGPPSFYRARGRAFEMLGEFEQAQRDYVDAMDAARVAKDRAAEWQSQIDLGFLWAGRDYSQAEPWLRQALALAKELDDPALQARSLNRIGNWHLNREQSHEALRYHQEALTIFQQLRDERGIAETLDLLGMTSYLDGDLIQGTDYFQRAIALFNELGDRQGLTSSLATMTLRGPTFQSDSMISLADLAEVVEDAERALRIAREMGHRSDEAFALFQLALCKGSQGEYERALAAARQSLNIAEEIEHLQWQAAAHCVLGGIYSGLLALPRARLHFEQSLELALAVGSSFWTRMARGYLMSLVTAQHDFTRAEEVLQTALSSGAPAQTMAQRLLLCASAELALAQEQPASALEIIDRIGEQVDGAEGQSGLRLLKLRGEALAALRRPTEAEAAFKAAQVIAAQQGARPMLWRIYTALGNLYQAQGKKVEAEQVFARARMLIEELAATVSDESLGDEFLQRANAMLPQVRPLTPKHAAKQAFGGLTARERQVAALIAQGKFNREIADQLVLSERTVESHVSNIMYKLGFNSRMQVAIWAVEKGLALKN